MLLRQSLHILSGVVLLLVCGFGSNLKAAVSYMIQLQFIRATRLKKQLHNSVVLLTRGYWMTIIWKPVRKVPVYTKLYVHISTDTLVDSRPFPLTTLYRFSTKLASPS